MFGTLKKFKTQHSSREESRAHGSEGSTIYIIFTTLNSKKLVIKSQGLSYSLPITVQVKSVFTNKVSQAFVSIDMAQGRVKLPVAKPDQS